MVTRRCAGVLVLALTSALLAVPNALAAGFPVTVAAANGKVTITKKPVRVISLSPTATEDLFAIGAGSQVIAVDDQSNYPARAPQTKLSGFTPNVEAIAAYKPDLVVISNDTGGIVKALGKLRIPVLLEPAATNLQDAYAQMRQLGKTTGNETRAASLVAKLRRQVALLIASLPARSERLAVYHELGPDYYSVTSRTFIGQVYTLLGLRNIADKADSAGSGYPKLSAEYIVAANPDIVVLSDTICCAQTAAKVKQRPGWRNIAAVKTGGIVEMSDDVASRWGPRVVDFIRTVAAKVRALGTAGARDRNE